MDDTTKNKKRRAQLTIIDESDCHGGGADDHKTTKHVQRM